MKKITSIILLLAVICLISAGYAVMSGDNNTNDNLASTVISEKSNLDSSSVLNTTSSSNKEVSTANNDAQKENGAENTQISHNIESSEGNTSSNKLDYFKSYNPGDAFFTDRYTQCAACGKFVPLGPVTNPIPEEALCHNINCDRLDELVPGLYYFSYSLEEVLYYSEHGSFDNYEGTLTRDLILSELGIDENEFFKQMYYNDRENNVEFTDRYAQCVCGKFVPLGPVTTPLPDEALCNGEDCGRVMDTWISTDFRNSYSIEEAMYLNEHNSFEGFEGVISRNEGQPTPINHCLENGEGIDMKQILHVMPFEKSAADEISLVSEYGQVVEQNKTII